MVQFSNDGETWESFGEAVVINGKLTVLTDHMSYFAVERTGDRAILPGAFPDVVSNYIYATAIAYLKANGMIQGYPDGTYKPNNNINRAEFTKIVVEARFSVEEINACIDSNAQSHWWYMFFTDVTIDAWYAKYVCVAKVNNIIAGYPDGMFKPSVNINLAEATKILVNTLNVSGVTPEGSAWYSEFVEAMTAKGYVPSTFTSPGALVNRGQMSEMIWRILEDVRDRAKADPAKLK